MISKDTTIYTKNNLLNRESNAWLLEISMNIIDLCVNKEKSNFKNIKGFNLFESELNTNEVHFKIKNKEFKVLRKHDKIDELRLEFFNWLLRNSDIDYQNIDCEFIINLDDDTLKTDFYAPRISFTKRDNSADILIPDPHFINTIGIIKGIKKSDIPVDQKTPYATFAGSDTGIHMCVEKNQRVQFCHQNQDNKNNLFKITNFCQIDRKQFEDFDISPIKSNTISFQEQLKYKYILNINGNSTAWDRLLWVMASNSICIFLKPEVRQYSWYYHIFDLLGGLTYVEMSNWQETINFLEKNPELSDYLNQTQKRLASQIANAGNQLFYFKEIFESYNKFYNNFSE